MSRHARWLAIGAPILLGLSGQELHGQQAGSMPVAHQFDNLHFRSIGPATMSGRISDFAVYEANPAIYYVGTAHGGVWKTMNGGTTFEPLFQDDGLMSIGDVTVSQKDPNLLWVGTGESNNRQSTSWGDGVYKTTDGGKTFQFMGLGNSKHINRIVIDPNDNNVVLVAATGPLFGAGGDRGVFKTTDGGKTWKQVLKVDDQTGANDLVMASSDPKILFASTYQRLRTACCMNGGGPGSGIWKSTDGGDTWTRITGHGLPGGSLGRIAIDVYRPSANIVYASIEGPSQGRGGGFGGGGGRGGGGGPDTTATGLYRSDDAGANWKKVSNTNPRPMYFSQVRIDPINPERVYMGGVGMQMTIDGGRTMETDAAMAAHDDNHAIWIDPGNPSHLLIGNDGGVYESKDMSRTWTFMPQIPVGLFYHVSYDMETPYNVCGGMQDNYDWCGPSTSRFRAGIMNYDWVTVQGGDGFVSLPDLRDSRIVYTESQDGNITRRNKVTGESKSIRPNQLNVTPAPDSGESYRFNWDTPMILSPHNPGILLVAANRVFKSTDRGDSWTVISPDLTSNADRDTIVTMGLKGTDINISRNDGIAAWPTIVALEESPRQAGLYYVGTDDGNVQVSRNGGGSWQNITGHLPGFPAGAWVSEVVPSRFNAATVYVTVDNHRLNDFKPYIWVSTDYGATFQSLVSNLVGENVRTLTEDQKNPDVLYIGTETGIFLSLDRGRSWQKLKANLPDVRVDEITLHPRDNAMLVATHGRSLWILDHLEPIQEYTATQAAAGDAKLFTVPTALEWKDMDDRNDEFWGHQYFIGENAPTEAMVQFLVKKPISDIQLRVSDGSGKLVREVDVPGNRGRAGIQSACWDLRVAPIETPEAAAGGRGGRGGGGGAFGGRGGGPDAVPGVPQPIPSAGYKPVDPCSGGEEGGGRGGFGGRGGGGGAGPYVSPGTYRVALVAGGKTLDSKTLRVTMDPAVQLAGGARASYDALVMGLHELQRTGTEVAGKLNSLYPQMADVSTKLKDMNNVPASVKSQFDTLNKDFDDVRVRFGVPLAGGGGGRGFGRGGGDPRNALQRVGNVKGQIANLFESPSAAVSRQAGEARSDLQSAISQGNAFLARARTMSQTLRRYNVTLDVPAP